MDNRETIAKSICRAQMENDLAEVTRLIARYEAVVGYRIG